MHVTREEKLGRGVLHTVMSRIGLLIGAILFAAIALEIFAQLHGAPIRLDVRGEYKVNIFRHDPLLGYALLSNLDVEGTKEEVGVRLVTDENGHRSMDFSAGLRNPCSTSPHALF